MRRLHWFMCIVILFIYLLLSWLQVVPSVIHIPVIRSLWDVPYRECRNYKENERSLENPGKLFITFSLHGRLGNSMFAYASLLGIAKMNNREPIIPSSHVLSEVFRVTHTNIISPVCMETFEEQRPCAYDSRVEDLPQSNLTMLQYFQSWRYFSDIKSDVLKQFQFHPWIRSKSRRQFLENVGPDAQNITTVGVHVRRTDMMIPSSTKLGFKAAPLSYITNAMNHMRLKFGSVQFVVVSDDTQWCRENLRSSDITIMPRNHFFMDLAVLSLCNHSIITTGTYGWWGAYLAGGYTVYYKNYPEPGSRLDRDTEHRDYYPTDWVGLNKAFVSIATKTYIFVVLILSIIHNSIILY